MTRYEFLRRTPVRLAIAFTSLFVITVITLFALLYFTVGTALESRIRTRVQQTADSLVAVSEERGFDDLAAVVESEGASIRDADSIFLLVDQQGVFQAGNVNEIADFNGWRVLNRADLPSVAEKGNTEDRFYAVWTPAARGRLLVGASDRDIRETQHLLLRGLAWGLAATVFLAGASAAIFAGRTQRRINDLASTLSAVSRGVITSRVPLTGAEDDLDKVAEQINRTLGHLQKLIESVNQVSSDIAHDLKMPIGRVRQRLDEARLDAQSVGEYRDTVELALVDLDSIVETFEALLRITQIEAGARKSRFSRLDLGEVLAEVAEVYEAVVEDAGHSLKYDEASAAMPAHIRGDRELLTQLFANLIENAIRHCPPGATIRLSLKAPDGAYLAEVSDTGPGIPESQRENVFRRLFRLERARSTPGNGLGLTLVAAVADLHDARVTLDDNHPGLRVIARFPKDDV